MKTKRIGHQQTYPKRIAKENSPNRKETMKEGNLENQEGMKNMLKKLQINAIEFSFPLEFSKLCLTVEAKVTAISYDSK